MSDELLNIEVKEDHPETLAQREGIDTKYYIDAQEFNQLLQAIRGIMDGKLNAGTYEGTAQDLFDLVKGVVGGKSILAGERIRFKNTNDGFPFKTMEGDLEFGIFQFGDIKYIALSRFLGGDPTIETNWEKVLYKSEALDQTDLEAHINNTNNPHQVRANQVPEGIDLSLIFENSLL